MTLDKLLPALTLDRTVHLARSLNREAVRYSKGCRPRAEMIANDYRRERAEVMRHARKLKAQQ